MQAAQTPHGAWAFETAAAAPGDDELVDRAANGDDDSPSRAIMRRHNRLLFRTARSILKVDAETEDALQEAYLRAWRALSKFRADSKLSTWLARIVINEALGRLRRRGAQVIPLDPAMERIGSQMERSMHDDADGRPEGEPRCARKCAG